LGARLYSRRLVQVQHRGAEHEDRCEDEQGEQTGDAYCLVAGLAQREEEDKSGEEDRDRERRERAERVDVVGARKLRATPQRVDEPATFHQRGRYRQTHERKPGQHEQVDPGEDPQPRDADRQERHEADGECDRDVATASDRTDERDRARIRRAQEERPCTKDDREPRRIIELCRGGADQRRPDAERERRPETDPVETERLRDKLPDRARLWRKWRRKRSARH